MPRAILKTRARRVAIPALAAMALGDPARAVEEAVDLGDVFGDPARLPPTLVMHRPQDICRVTLASGVESFGAWVGARARTVRIDGGTSEGDLCRARAYHGFVGREGAVVSSIAGFAGSLR